MAATLTNEAIRAAGGVLWRHAAGGNGPENLEIALIHRPRYDDWSIPKGKLNPGEIEIEGAVREVNEETGHRVSIGRPLGVIDYLKDGRPKSVRYWAMRSEGGVFTPTREVDQMRWVPVPEALNILSRDRDRDVLVRFSTGPIQTKAILLVRHALAGNRSDWAGDDRDRPLDNGGRSQAEALVWLLTRFDIREIYSADLARCTQTVEPLSKAVGLPVQPQPLVSEDLFYERETDALAFMRSVGAEGTGTAICSQGGVIPDIVAQLAEEADLPMPGSIAAKKGSVWSLTFSGDRLHDAEYFPPLN